MTDRDRVRRALERAASLHQRVAETQSDAVVKAALAIRAALEAGRHVLVFGNGGSATDAQHFAAELVGRFGRERTGWPVIALTADSAILTSVANDYGFEAVFARQVEALGREGDVLIGISTSGNSANVVKAFERARAAGLRTIAFTGASGGALGPLADVQINVPSSETSHTQEAHIAVGQLIAFLVEDELFPR